MKSKTLFTSRLTIGQAGKLFGVPEKKLNLKPRLVISVENSNAVDIFFIDLFDIIGNADIAFETDAVDDNRIDFMIVDCRSQFKYAPYLFQVVAQGNTRSILIAFRSVRNKAIHVPPKLSFPLL